jgi:membrane-associated protease RseP (regulator of RpoE activity)
MLPTNASMLAVSDDDVNRLRAAVQQFMQVEDTTVGEGPQFAVRFRGRLTQDSVAAYALASTAFRAAGYTPLFRPDGDRHAVLAVKGTYNPKPSRAWINAVMFAFTLLSVLFVGATYSPEVTLPATVGGWVSFMLGGLPFATSLLGILLAHEFGHYFAARYHKVAVTLPYFIPFPTLFGTMGAFIQLKEPPTNRRVLMDIGVAGPLAGLVVAVPVLFYGLLTSPVARLPTTLPADLALTMEGNSILYVVMKFLAFGKLLPEPASFGGLPPLLYMLRFYALGIPAPFGGLDVQLNQVAWAGWAGLLVTALNLIPAGQLDGGHTLFVLIGKRMRAVQNVILVILAALGFLWNGWWLYALLIYFLVGRAYAEPLDQITTLDPGRRLLAILTLVIFVLIFMPVPLTLFTR